MVVGVMTCCALIHSLCVLKTAQRNAQYSLIFVFGGISSFVGYLNPKLSCRRTAVILFNP